MQDNANDAVYIIAEAGVNHNGSLELAKQLVDIAADAGADAVKFQTFTADNLLKKGTKKAPYQTVTTGTDADQYEMIKALELSDESHFILAEYCGTRNIDFLSTPFDQPSAAFLAKNFFMPYMKIPSCDLTNAPLIYDIARENSHIILSTGMSTMGEIEEALSVIGYVWSQSAEPPSEKAFKTAYQNPKTRQLLRDGVILMHCISNYPAPREAINLRAMNHMRDTFQVPVGYSDHSLGIDIALMAVALGAAMIEKHFTIDKHMAGPDHPASLDPEELKSMVSEIRKIQADRRATKRLDGYIERVTDAEAVLGNGIKKPHACELQNITAMRKSLVAHRDIRKGQVIGLEDIIPKRPSGGIAPIKFWEMVGSIATRDYQRDDSLMIGKACA